MTSECIEQTLISLLMLRRPGSGVLVKVRLLMRTPQTCGLLIEANIYTQTATHRQGTSDTTGQLVVGLAVGGGEKSVMQQSTLIPEL